MIKKYLIDRMGIDVVRNEKSDTDKPKIEYKIGYKAKFSFSFKGFWLAEEFLDFNWLQIVTFLD